MLRNSEASGHPSLLRKTVMRGIRCSLPAVPASPPTPCHSRRFSIVLCIGEAEAILPRMLPVLKEGVSEDRGELLKKLATLPGVYVPRHSQNAVARQWPPTLMSFPVTFNGADAVTPSLATCT